MPTEQDRAYFWSLTTGKAHRHLHYGARLATLAMWIIGAPLVISGPVSWPAGSGSESTVFQQMLTAQAAAARAEVGALLVVGGFVINALGTMARATRQQADIAAWELCFHYGAEMKAPPSPPLPPPPELVIHCESCLSVIPVPAGAKVVAGNHVRCPKCKGTALVQAK